MNLRSWLSTCSSTTSTATVNFADYASSTSTASSTTSNTSTSSSSSIQSNLSLQTLPSVPSLNLSPHHTSLDIFVTHHALSSLKPPSSHNLPITCLALRRDLLFAASGHIIHVYQLLLPSITHLHAFNSHASSTGSVKSITFCNDDKTKVFTAHQDGKIRVWQLTKEPPPHQRYKLITTLPTLNDRLLRFPFPKNYVAVRRHKKKLWIEHTDAVTALAADNRNGLIYSVSWDKTLKVWRSGDLRCVESVTAHHDAVNAVVVSADGTVYTGSADRRIRVWAKTEGGKSSKRFVLVATLEKHKSAVNALALNDDGSVLFSGACDRSILVWEREDSANYMAVTGALRGHDKAIMCLVNVDDLLMSGSADRTARIWRRGCDGRYCCLAVLEGHVNPVKSLAAVLTGDGVVSVFTGSLDGEIKVWQVLFSNLNRPLTIEEKIR